MNGFDMSRPAGAWVKKPAGVNSNAASIAPAVAAAEPAQHQWRAPVYPRQVPIGGVLRPASAGRPEAASAGFPQAAKVTAVRYRARTVAVAGMVFVASALAVFAVAALVVSRPLEASAGSPEVGPALQAVLSGEEIAPPDSPVSPEVAPAVEGDPGKAVSLGSIRIPAIDLDAAYFAGVHDAVVARGPGLWPGTPVPGAAGNSVFAGHRTTHTRPFEDLDRLKPGDVIEATGGSDVVTEFRVVSIKTIRESEYVEYALADFDPDGSPSITLLACAPKGSRTHRIVVRATATQAPERGDA